MIHDAYVEVTCDGKDCHESVTVDLPFVYGGTMHTQGHYDHDESRIGELVEKKYEWIVKADEHFCSKSCAKSSSLGISIPAT